MTVSEDYKIIYAELLKEIYPECHNCKYLIEVDYLDGDGMEHTGLICNDDLDMVRFVFYTYPTIADAPILERETEVMTKLSKLETFMVL